MSYKRAKKYKELLEIKYNYDAMDEAVRIAATNGVDNFKEMTIVKNNLKDQYIAVKKEVLANMSLRTNVIQLEGSWHAVRYMDNKLDTHLKLYLLNPSDTFVLLRDCNTESNLSKKELDTFIPGIIDQPAIDNYKTSVQSKAITILGEYTGEEWTLSNEDKEEEQKQITVSHHARQRWVERRLGIKGNTQIDNYIRENYTQINEDIIKEFKGSEHFWHEPTDNVDFYFDEANFMYVYCDNNIVTLYEEDFGFTTEINRIVTLQQKEVIKEAHNELLSATDEHDEVMQRVNREIQSVEDEIKVLEQKIDLLRSNKRSVLNEQEESLQKLKYHQATYNAETNKLFKKWEMPNK